MSVRRRTAVALALAGIAALPASALARSYGFLGVGPSHYTIGRRTDGVGMGIATAASFGGAPSFLVVAQFDRLNDRRHPTLVLAGLRAQASEGATPYVDFATGVNWEREDSGFALAVGAGWHALTPRGPGWFADLHYVKLGGFEATPVAILQLRLGLSTP